MISSGYQPPSAKVATQPLGDDLALGEAGRDAEPPRGVDEIALRSPEPALIRHPAYSAVPTSIEISLWSIISE